MIARHLHDLQRGEARVNEVYFAWRAGRLTPLDEELDSRLERWRAVPDGGELVLEWPVPARAR